MTIPANIRRLIDFIRRWLRPVQVKTQEIETQEIEEYSPAASTVDDKLPFPGSWYGELYGKQVRRRDGIARVCKMLADSMLDNNKLPADAIDQAGRYLCLKHDATADDVAALWNRLECFEFPKTKEDIWQWLLDFVREADASFVRARQERIDAYNAERQRKREEKQRLKGMAMPADV